MFTHKPKFLLVHPLVQSLVHLTEITTFLESLGEVTYWICKRYNKTVRRAFMKSLFTNYSSPERNFIFRREFKNLDLVLLFSRGLSSMDTLLFCHLKHPVTPSLSFLHYPYLLIDCLSPRTTTNWVTEVNKDTKSE